MVWDLSLSLVENLLYSRECSLGTAVSLGKIFVCCSETLTLPFLFSDSVGRGLIGSLAHDYS